MVQAQTRIDTKSLDHFNSGSCEFSEEDEPPKQYSASKSDSGSQMTKTVVFVINVDYFKTPTGNLPPPTRYVKRKHDRGAQSN